MNETSERPSFTVIGFESDFIKWVLILEFFGVRCIPVLFVTDSEVLNLSLQIVLTVFIQAINLLLHYGLATRVYVGQETPS